MTCDTVMRLTLGVEPPAVAGPPLQRDAVSQKAEELLEALAARL